MHFAENFWEKELEGSHQLTGGEQVTERITNFVHAKKRC